MEATTRKLIRDYGGTVLGAVVVALLIRFFIIEAYRIPTAAMKPALEPGDTVFVAKAPLGISLFGLGRPHRNDVVLFHDGDTSGPDYIKRIIGLPGETVQLHDGKLSIDGKALTDDIRPHGNCGTESLPDGKKAPVCFEPPMVDDFGPEKIPSGSVFVMGDFRSARLIDATNLGKSWGIIPLSWIRGRALWVWLSVEPASSAEDEVASGPFPKLRLERMFRRIK